MEKESKVFKIFDKITRVFEIVIAITLIIIILAEFIEFITDFAGIKVFNLNMSFQEILNIAFNLIIGLEFTRMLYTPTPRAIIHILLFAIARQMILHSRGVIDSLLCVIAIAGLFAINKYLISRTKEL